MMKNYLISKLNTAILAIIAILGFACDKEVINRVEYGMPNANFKANGNIVDETTQEKLSNIRIVFREALISSVQGDTAYSDEKGNYEVKLNTSPTTTAFVLLFEDIDGVENGTYLEEDSVIDFSGEEFKNGEGTWYLGEKSKVINMKLSPGESKND